MKARKQIKGLSATLCYTLLSSAILTASAQAQVAQTPLNLSEGVPPNMIFTLDESGSMSWGFIPDTSAQPYKDLIGSNNNKRYHANNTNPLAYNPNLVYEIPPAFDEDGEQFTLSTDFYDAPANGFGVQHSTYNPRINLSTEYRPIYEHRIPLRAPNYSHHPFFNPFSCSVSIRNNNSTGRCTIGGTSVSVRRVSSGCNNVNPSSITLNIEGKTLQHNLSCSRSYNTVTITSTGEFPAFYYEFDGQLDNGKCAARKNNDNGGGEDCYRLRWVDANSAYDKDGVRLRHPDGTLVDGRQNFAIWYSFYRSRALATLSAAKIAFYDLSPDIRFTWQDLKTCTSFTNENANCGKNKLKPYSNKHRGEFYTWLRKRYFNVGTPLPAAMNRAGEFLLTEPNAWKKNPWGTGNTTENTYACRPSYHVLMTDGMWNETASNPDGFRSDHTTFTTPAGEIYEGQSYNGQKPFHDNAGNSTLADLAMHYWATDLNPDLANQITPYVPFKNTNKSKEFWDPRNNPAEWQSMSNFIMALGLTTSLGSGSNSHLPWENTTYAGEAYEKLRDGTHNWPRAQSGSGNNVYDLWHAAVNSRGEFYSVDTPEGMVQAFKDILSRIADRKSSAARPGTNNAMESDTPEGGDRLASYFYQTSYDSTVWSGDIEQIKRYREYNNNYNPNNPESVQYTEYSVSQGKASENLPDHDKRNIKMANSSGTGLVDFKTNNAGNRDTKGTLAYYLSFKGEDGVQDNLQDRRLNYLRGERTHEGDEVNSLRTRGNTVLGDFFASQPVVVSGARYLAGVADKLEGTNSYKEFVTTAKARPQILYVGGNDGMLHAFNTSNMKEIFAFVPTAVFPKLHKLTNTNYTHEYFVDGSPVVADVYDKTSSKWRTILVGTLRAGGKGMFALDVTNPGENGEGIKLLWELTADNIRSNINDNPVNVKPGYSFSKPTIARLHNGSWAVVAGNGYKSEGANNGAAALYIIDAMTGELKEYLEVQSPINNLENGLSTPTLADFDGDGVADYAYAGDLHGNLWRFDLLGATATPPSLEKEHGSYGDKNDVARFAVSNGGNPLFTAESENGSVQPITAPPTLIRHPTRRGYIVSFGTGRYFEIGDKAGDESTYQTVYGIWDQNTKAEETNDSAILREDLQEQKIGMQSTGVGHKSGKDRDTRLMGAEEVKWDGEKYGSGLNDTGTMKGWYFDLKVGNNGAKDGEMVIEKIEALGSTLFMQTLVPNDDPCTSGASNWLYAIDAFTGGQTEHHAFDTRGPNGEIISAIKFGTEGGVSISQDETGYRANAPGDQEPLAPSPDDFGRQSWRMIQDI